MIELLPVLNTAINLVGKLRDISDKLKHAELKSLIADLTLQMADLKIGMAGLLEENDDLKRKIRKLESSENDPCPRCKKRTWAVEDIVPDEIYGMMGATRHNYRCSECGLTESKLVKRDRR
jgi:hypothetical protein